MGAGSGGKAARAVKGTGRGWFRETAVGWGFGLGIRV